MMHKADILKVGIALVAIQLACVSQASWYWPFGSDKEEKKPPRLSELMEPASLLIDEASDLVAAGSNDVAVARYRAALQQLDEIETTTEAEFPGLTKKPEFSTLKTKRAYVNAAIDSLLLGQVKANARAVAISDTTDLERRLAEEKKGVEKDGDAASRRVKPVDAESLPRQKEKSVDAESLPRQKKSDIDLEGRGKDSASTSHSLSLREQAIRDIMAGDYVSAKLSIDEMLTAKPNSAAALNLQAIMEIRQDKLKEAELTLDRCIANNPKSYFAYYNMCELFLRKGNKTGARRYYDTGRAYGGPRKLKLEKALK